jgi:hypothetical protein
VGAQAVYDFVFSAPRRLASRRQVDAELLPVYALSDAKLGLRVAVTPRLRQSGQQGGKGALPAGSIS